MLFHAHVDRLSERRCTPYRLHILLVYPQSIYILVCIANCTDFRLLCFCLHFKFKCTQCRKWRRKQHTVSVKLFFRPNWRFERISMGPNRKIVIQMILFLVVALPATHCWPLWTTEKRKLSWNGTIHCMPVRYVFTVLAKKKILTRIERKSWDWHLQKAVDSTSSAMYF